MKYKLQITNWVRVLMCVLFVLCVPCVLWGQITNTAVMLRNDGALLPTNAAGVISNALGLGPWATATNITIPNVDGLQGALAGKLATNGILPAYTNVAGLQSWVTNTNTPLFLPVGTNGVVGFSFSAPVATNSMGVPGQVFFSTNYLYVCVGSNEWRRVLLGTW